MPQPAIDPGARPERRVLVVSRVAFLGGVERTILTLTQGLEGLGWRPVIASPGGGALESQAAAQGTATIACDLDRMRITADPRVLAGYFLAWRRGRAAIERGARSHGVHLIHVHHPVTALYAAPAARRLGIPLVLSIHETLPARWLYALALRKAVKQATMILCVSEAARALASAMGAAPERTRVVPNGVDPCFLSAAPRLRRPQEMEGTGPGPHIGVFGVLEERKAQHVLLEAAERIAVRAPSARYWLVGPAALKDKKAYAERLRRQAGAPALHGRVALAGYQADVRSWIEAMDIVVQPSVALESFGMSLAEALVLERCVIASRVGGMPEVVREGSTGLIVAPGDAGALAEALVTLIDSPERRSELGRNGAADARTRFSPEAFQSSVVAAYEAALLECID